MPKLDIAAGIAIGAKSFMDSFTQARMYKEQQKLQKNQIILEAVYRQLADQNLPYRERIRLFNAIPGLAGIKMDTTLSQQFGLDELLEKEVETEEAKPATPARQLRVPQEMQQATIGGTGEGEISTEVRGLGTELNLPGQQATPAKKLKYGDLSPAQHNAILRRREKALEDEDEFSKAKKLAELNFELQQSSVKRLGFNRIIGDGHNSAGEYVVVAMNPAGETKEVKMAAGFKPSKQIIAEIRAGATGAGGRKYTPSVRNLIAHFERQTNPITGEQYTPEEAEQEALKMYAEGFETEQEAKVIRKGVAENILEGTTPISPAQKADDAARDEANAIARERNYLEIKRDADTASELATAKAEQVNRQGIIVADAQRAFDAAKDTYASSEPQYVAAERELHKQQGILNSLITERDSLQGRARTATTAANDYAKKVGRSTETIAPIQDWQVKKFRTANSKNPKIQKMSDAEIRIILERNRDKWRR